MVKRDGAAIGGIGNSNFDLWGTGRAPSLIAAHHSQPGVGKTGRDPVAIRASFLRGIGAKK